MSHICFMKTMKGKERGGAVSMNVPRRQWRKKKEAARFLDSLLCMAALIQI